MAGAHVLQSLIGLLLWPVVWALCFALFAVLGASTFSGGGPVATQLVKPWVSVAALYVSFKAPQLLARQAMLAGLTPSIGGAAARGLFLRARRHARRLGRSGRWRRATDSDRGSVKVPTHKHLEGRLRLGAFTLGQWAQIRRGHRSGRVRRLPVATADPGDDLRRDPRRRPARRRLLRRHGAGVLVGQLLAAAWRYWRLPRRYPPGAGSAATGYDCCPSRMNPSVRSRPSGGSCCGTREARRDAGRGRSVSDRGARPRGLAVTSEGALVRCCAPRRRTRS